jgi:hypothetical protein
VGRLDNLRKLKGAATEKVGELDLGKVAGDAVVGLSAAVDGAEAVAKRSGLTKKNGDVSKVKVARAVLRPRKTARTVLGAASDEILARRGSDPDDAQSPEDRIES